MILFPLILNIKALTRPPCTNARFGWSPKILTFFMEFINFINGYKMNFLTFYYLFVIVDQIHTWQYNLVINIMRNDPCYRGTTVGTDTNPGSSWVGTILLLFQKLIYRVISH